MARKSAPESKPRATNDTLGIIFFAVAVLALIALFSYDKKDLDINSVPPNKDMHNWAGLVGAKMAHSLFYAFGAAAYLLPIVLFFLSLGYLLSFLTYLQRRWLWATSLLFACMGLLDLYNHHFLTVQQNLNIPSAGGIIGNAMNNMVFNHFGLVGATILFITIYSLSLLYLTNFRLGEWLRAMWEMQLAKREIQRQAFNDRNLSAEEKALAKRAKQLEKEARKLQGKLDEPEKPITSSKEKVKEKPSRLKRLFGGGDDADDEKPDQDDDEEISKLGADGMPLPEPTVRDLSVPQARDKKGSSNGSPPKKSNNPFQSEPAEPDNTPVQMGAVITADEIEAKMPSSDAPLRELAADKTALPAAAAPVRSLDDDDEPLPLPLNSGPKPKVHGLRKSKPITVATPPMIGNYQLPPVSMLNLPDMTIKPTETKEELMANARLMQSTLAQFQIEVSLGDITKGPTITRYELHPAPGVRLEKIAALTNNIAAALKAERINILAPVPGKSSVGVEVPNAVKTKVIMRDLVESEEWINSKARIPLCLGKDVYGHPIIGDLAEMPHVLIAGSTGSGKSVCINAIIASLLFKFSPDQLRFVMIDPKVVEMQQYNALPHLVVPVVTDPKKVVLALRWVVNEMEKRYQIFAKVGVRNIKSFNERQKAPPPPPPAPPAPGEKPDTNPEGVAVELDQEIVVPREDDVLIPEKLSYIVVIIDELADLMLVAPADVEMAIARITQMARAAGIHCIVATQRPSVDVITGVIKANIPARIAFQVAAKVDSRTILDAMGADKLLGKGDMLYLPPGSAKLNRAQGVLITDQEIESIVDFISKQGKPSYEMEIHQQLAKPAAGGSEEGDCDEDEALIEQCIEVIRSEQKASVSLMQRRLRLGYTRAARIMDELERRGIVGPSKGAEPRDILIDLDGTGADGAGQGLNIPTAKN
ncbi:MAG: DNA translocase FtsK 4TM domain-containing protein [Verrucomicrobiales bacterium]